jgi:hypothetical protein
MEIVEREMGGGVILIHGVYCGTIIWEKNMAASPLEFL